jgi:hypothetical protein
VHCCAVQDNPETRIIVWRPCINGSNLLVLCSLPVYNQRRHFSLNRAQELHYFQYKIGQNHSDIEHEFNYPNVGLSPTGNIKDLMLHSIIHVTFYTGILKHSTSVAVMGKQSINVIEDIDCFLVSLSHYVVT